MSHAAAIALTLLVALVVVAFAALFVPVHVRFSAEGRGDPSGRWAIAGGASVGQASLAMVAARGVAPRLHGQLRRWSFGPWSLGALLARFGKNAPPSDDPPARRTLDDRFHALEAGYARLERWLDPVELVLFLVDSRRRAQLGRLDVTTRFGDADVALVGKITGAILVLSTVLGPRVHITPEPIWTGESVVSFALEGDVTLRPGLFVVDVLLHLVKNVRVLPARPEPARTETLP